MDKHGLNRTFFILYGFVLGPLAVVLILGAGIAKTLGAGTSGPEFSCVQVGLAAIWFCLFVAIADGYRINFWRGSFPGWQTIPLTIGIVVGVGGALGTIVGSGFLAWLTIELLLGSDSLLNPIGIVLTMFVVAIPTVAMLKQSIEYLRDESS